MTTKCVLVIFALTRSEALSPETMEWSMSMPMRKVEPEKPVEQRVARIEAHVEHIQSDVTELKVDFRRLAAKVDVLQDKMHDGFAALNDKIDRKVAWLIGLMVILATGCASGFLWLADRINALSSVLLGH